MLPALMFPALVRMTLVHSLLPNLNPAKLTLAGSVTGLL